MERGLCQKSGQNLTGFQCYSWILLVSLNIGRNSVLACQLRYQFSNAFVSDLWRAALDSSRSSRKPRALNKEQAAYFNSLVLHSISVNSTDIACWTVKKWCPSCRGFWQTWLKESHNFPNQSSDLCQLTFTEYPSLVLQIIVSFMPSAHTNIPHNVSPDMTNKYLLYY